MQILSFVLAPLVAMRDNHVATCFGYGLESVIFCLGVSSLSSKRRANKVLSVTVLLALFAATLAISITLSASLNGALALSIAVLSTAAWFVLTPILLAQAGVYYVYPFKDGRAAIIGWTKYSLSFFSTFYTLLAAVMLPASYSAGIVECQTAVIGWMLTYIAFTYPNRFVPQWLQKKLAD
jgi:hypothetical protein